MKLKKVPKEPTRKLNKTAYHDVLDGETIKSLFDRFPDGVIDIEYGWDDNEYRVKYQQDEPLAEFDRRYQRYLTEKAVYDAWYKENETEIKAELETRKLKDTERLQKRLLKLEEDKRKTLEKIEKDQKVLEKILNKS